MSGGGNETIGYYTNDMINTLTQGGLTETWTLDPAGRDYTSTQTGSSVSTTDHYSDPLSDSPSWSTIVNASGVTSSSVDDADLTGELAASTSDTTSASSISYLLTDPQGNVIGSADPASPTELVSPVITDDYGNIQTLAGAPTPGPRYGWLGGDQRDASSLGGVLLAGARGYLPLAGRFLSTDPILGANDNPYDYPADPVNENDSSGLERVPPPSGGICTSISCATPKVGAWYKVSDGIRNSFLNYASTLLFNYVSSQGWGDFSIGDVDERQEVFTYWHTRKLNGKAEFQTVQVTKAQFRAEIDYSGGSPFNPTTISRWHTFGWGEFGKQWTRTGPWRHSPHDSI